MKDYVPSNDVEFKAWMTNFLAVLEPVITQFGMVETDLDVLRNFSNTFGSAVDDYVQKDKDARSACRAKKDARGGVLGRLRPLVSRINNHPAMTDALRVDLCLNPRHLVQATIPIQEMIPAMLLDSYLGQVVVHWGPNPGNERINGKPDGVKGAVIYRKKAGDADYQIVGHATRSPFYDNITGDAADYTYIVRYHGTKQTELSKQSEPGVIAARGDIAA